MIADILDSKAFRIVLIVLIAYLVLKYLGNILPNLFKSAKQNIAENQAGTAGNQVALTNGTGETADLNALANAYHSAIYGLGTDEEMLYDLAAKTRPPLFKQVSDRYRSLHKADLMQDLKDDLDTAELQKFLQIAGLY